MNTLARISTQYMLGINATLVLWLWLGRLLVGTAGWGLAFFPILVAPWLVPLLLVTTFLARRRYPMAVWDTKPDRHGATMLSRPQAIAQLTAWVGMAGTGLFLMDYADVGPEGSVYSMVLGLVLGDLVDLRLMTNITSMVYACVFALGWLALLALLAMDGPRKTAGRRAIDDEAQSEATVSGTA